MKKNSIKESIVRYSENNNQENDIKDEEYVRRRFKKREECKQTNSQRRMKIYRHMYIPTIICITTGIITTMAASVQSIGGNTFFWNSKEEFRIAGPVILTSGLVFLLVTVGLTNEEQLRMRREERERNAKAVESTESCECNCVLHQRLKNEPRGLYQSDKNIDYSTLLRTTMTNSESQTENRIQKFKNDLPSIHIETERYRKLEMDSEGSSEGDTFVESNLPSASTGMTSLGSPSHTSFFEFPGKRNASRQSSSESRQLETSFTHLQPFNALPVQSEKM